MEPSLNISTKYASLLYHLVCERLLAQNNGTLGAEEASCTRALRTGNKVSPILESYFSTYLTSKIILSILYGIAFCVAVVGNLLVILTFGLNRHMRSTTNCFILSLAISDFLMAVTCMPINLGTVLTTFWVFGSFACKLVPFVMSVAVGCSSLTLCCIALDRYKAIVHPLKPKFFNTPRRVAILLIIVWLFAAISAIPNAVFYEMDEVLLQVVSTNGNRTVNKSEQGPYYICTWPGTDVQEIVTLWFHLLFLFALPFGIMVIFYGIIGYRLWIRKPVGIRLTYYEDINTKLKKKAIKMLVTVVVLFVICWMPLLLVDIIQMARLSRTVWILRRYLELLALSSTCYNPIVYSVMNERFKKNFASVLLCRRNQVGISGFTPKAHNTVLKPSVTRIEVKSNDNVLEIQTVSVRM